MRYRVKLLLLLLLTSFWDPCAWCATEPGDVAVLEKIRKGLDNPELLKWPSGDPDPCGNKWPHVYCAGNRVSQIQLQNFGLSGRLPEDFNELTELVNLGLQRNNFSGELPSLSGLSKLQYAFLNENQFDTIPADFFNGLSSLEVLALSKNPLNVSGWMLPKALGDSAQLTNLSLIDCNLIGPLPEVLGSMHSLTVLQMSDNMLSGEIPQSYATLPLQILWLNEQKGNQISGTIDAIASMTMLREAWLHGNSFTGMIPSSIGQLVSLESLWLNNNQLVGVIPENIAALKQLQSLRLDNNFFVGAIPETSIANFSYSNNPTCQDTPGVPCSVEVTALLDFLNGVNYPVNLAKSWSGNDPCNGWLGVSCSGSNVSTINLPNFNLNGTLSPSLSRLSSLVHVFLQGNHLNGTIPTELTSLQSLKLLNLSSNNLEPPVPKFSNAVNIIVDNNILIQNPGTPSSGGDNTSGGRSSTPSKPVNGSSESKRSKQLVIVVPVVVGIFFLSLAGFLICLIQKKKRLPPAVVVHPKDSSDPDSFVKVAVADFNANSLTATGDLHSNISSATTESHVVQSGNLTVSVQILRSATQNFSASNELGRGGFGVVYKGELHDGSMIAVKRMESAVISKKGFEEFQAEIAVLSKVRHRNLVSLLGYSIEGNERLLVYEYMAQGALSRHLFKWRELALDPLPWKRRLNIALDVARAMEYLHTLAQDKGFIHRDLKSSNILLDDDFHAKVSDFGLVKLAPNGDHSMATRLAGTFGYLAPESFTELPPDGIFWSTVTGKITTKADVFSFGVVLLELVTGLMALDEDRCDEKRYLVSWFCDSKWSREKLKEAVDQQIDASDEEAFQSVCKVVELAGHCTARDPHQRPDMGHAVNVLSSMVQKWKPGGYDLDENFGIDFGQPLLQMVKGWQDADGTCFPSRNIDDSKESIPARPAGFAESFTSLDGR
ncbi:putative receptor protein kinase TMK1 [Apostasia shenzhenica]|uniref:Putative receptor protein kinase TMK1 n=1 Tax=Apostasia shenzhenica TaxID=1088818 RepID=A0A2I0AS04_9ASPA|nr:putative receptor protein kinase TMK1 [Apostasia shenzhenica]